VLIAAATPASSAPHALKLLAIPSLASARGIVVVVQGSCGRAIHDERLDWCFIVDVSSGLSS
jgi:hypothetical protein